MDASSRATMVLGDSLLGDALARPGDHALPAQLRCYRCRLVGLSKTLKGLSLQAISPGVSG
jgi:hypothetical protein